MDYSGLLSTATTQIADKGRSITLIHKNQGSYNSATDSISGQSSSSETVSAVFTEYDQKDIDGTLIKAGDKRAMISASGIASAPDTADQVTDGSLKYSIISVSTIQPGGTPLIYYLQLRRGG